ncbi:MAG TPA: 3'(2'),5'-bisphosphate nucleotidase CysQ [Steroidobacteraceae bacterium]|nr:3'(2'),5'-bisphosphate nucleotidase CysQ [Steroidobacteraceae bacterium]
MQPAPHLLLTDVVALAREAGAAILEVYAGEFDVRRKGDDSPLTVADLRAHRIISAGLGRLTPDVPVISEEAPAPPLAERGRWEWLWLVDPLDGTREFVERSGEFTVNIALIHRHAAVLGVLHVPLSGVDYYAAAGSGAFRQGRDGVAVRIAARARIAGPPRVVASRSHRGSRLDGFFAALGPHEFRPLGSAAKFGLIADGSADLYPRVGPTSEWDTAAGQAIAEVAGARVVGRDGEPLRYNARDSLINPDFVCYADGSRPWHEYL